MANKRAKIYERVQVEGRWTDRPVVLPKLKADGTLYLKDDREGKFRISWYEGKAKQWHPTVCSWLGDALRVKEEREWFLKNQNRPGVQDPTVLDQRSPISISINNYIDGVTGAKKTKAAHRQALREFEAWNGSLNNGSKKKFVDEIDKAHLARFFDYLVDDEPENCPFTAAWKIMRVNKFIRTVLKLDPGKGPIKKSDYRRELKSGENRPEIYTREELKLLFDAMTSDEELVFEVFLKAGLRKQEMMFLEEDDLIVETLAPGIVKRQIRVTSKPSLGFMTKNGRARYIPIDRDLMDRLLALKATKRPSGLLFGTRNGLPDYHMLDTLRQVAGRAGIDPARCWLHKFRATCATNWMRPERLGGKGNDIGLVREWLGHDDYKSIEAYYAIVREEELIVPDEPHEPIHDKTVSQSLTASTICFGCRFEDAEVQSRLSDGSQVVFCPVCRELAYESGGNRKVISKIA
ncbi:MAG TPA: site-specific integrase [Candidatus Sulfotelmatobacter sp.]|nr:site-specific integrase [Candidatus Sulfotelmatobacter sp.]HEV2469932.1 site-specific integrase [Candidatus Sulfotelmatobacter sp.]